MALRKATKMMMAMIWSQLMRPAVRPWQWLMRWSRWGLTPPSPLYPPRLLCTAVPALWHVSLCPPAVPLCPVPVSFGPDMSAFNTELSGNTPIWKFPGLRSSRNTLIEEIHWLRNFTQNCAATIWLKNLTQNYPAKLWLLNFAQNCLATIWLKIFTLNCLTTFWLEEFTQNYPAKLWLMNFTQNCLATIQLNNFPWLVFCCLTTVRSVNLQHLSYFKLRLIDMSRNLLDAHIDLGPG